MSDNYSYQDQARHGQRAADYDSSGNAGIIWALIFLVALVALVAIGASGTSQDGSETTAVAPSAEPAPQSADQ